MAERVKYYRNYDSGDATYVLGPNGSWIVQEYSYCEWSPPSGYEFAHWNSLSDNSGVSYDPGDEVQGLVMSYPVYAIYRELVIPDIDITYKGSSIATMSASGTLTLDTAGTYCEDDIVITYTKPS